MRIDDWLTLIMDGSEEIKVEQCRPYGRRTVNVAVDSSDCGLKMCFESFDAAKSFLQTALEAVILEGTRNA